MDNMLPVAYTAIQTAFPYEIYVSFAFVQTAIESAFALYSRAHLSVYIEPLFTTNNNNYYYYNYNNSTMLYFLQSSDFNNTCASSLESERRLIGAIAFQQKKEQLKLQKKLHKQKKLMKTKQQTKRHALANSCTTNDRVIPTKQQPRPTNKVVLQNRTTEICKYLYVDMQNGATIARYLQALLDRNIYAYCVPIVHKVLTWYVTREKLNQLPSSSDKLHNAIKPMCTLSYQFENLYKLEQTLIINGIVKYNRDNIVIDTSNIADIIKMPNTKDAASKAHSQRRSSKISQILPSANNKIRKPNNIVEEFELKLLLIKVINWFKDNNYHQKKFTNSTRLHNILRTLCVIKRTIEPSTLMAFINNNNILSPDNHFHQWLLSLPSSPSPSSSTVSNATGRYITLVSSQHKVTHKYLSRNNRPCRGFRLF